MNQIRDKIDYNQSTSSPKLEDAFCGVKILLTEKSTHEGAKEFYLHGVFQINSLEAEKIGVSFLHRALILTVTSGLYNNSWNIVGDSFLFNDDQILLNNFYTGYFNVRLNWFLEFEKNRDYYVTISLGTNLSNTVIAKVF